MARNTAAIYHSHLHVMATDGALMPDGIFHASPTMSLAPMEELFRHRVFKMLMKKGLLNPERVKLMESWEHSGLTSTPRCASAPRAPAELEYLSGVD